MCELTLMKVVCGDMMYNLKHKIVLSNAVIKTYQCRLTPGLANAGQIEDGVKRKRRSMKKDTDMVEFDNGLLSGKGSFEGDTKNMVKVFVAAKSREEVTKGRQVRMTVGERRDSCIRKITTKRSDEEAHITTTSTSIYGVLEKLISQHEYKQTFLRLCMKEFTWVQQMISFAFWFIFDTYRGKDKRTFPRYLDEPYTPVYRRYGGNRIIPCCIRNFVITFPIRIYEIYL